LKVAIKNDMSECWEEVVDSGVMKGVMV
jgi:hypothetical protein